MRRPLTVLIAVLTALVVPALAGCGSAADSASSSASSGGSSGAAAGVAMPAAEGAVSYPVTLTSPYGETVLPKRPERLVAIAPSGEDAALLLQLGVVPVAAAELINDTSEYVSSPGPADIKERIKAEWSEVPPYEAIAALKPDAIVALRMSDGGGQLSADAFKRLTAIAPVITDTAAVTTWQDAITVLGRALDLPAAAKKVVTDSETFFTRFRAEHPSFEKKTGSWAIAYPDGLNYYLVPGSSPAGFFEDMGFVLNADSAELAAQGNISAETYSLLDADVILLGKEDEASYKKVVDAQTFKNVPAVKAGRVITLDLTGADAMVGWAIGFGGADGLRWAAEKLEARLSETLP